MGSCVGANVDVWYKSLLQARITKGEKSRKRKILLNGIVKRTVSFKTCFLVMSKSMSFSLFFLLVNGCSYDYDEISYTKGSPEANVISIMLPITT